MMHNDFCKYFLNEMIFSKSKKFKSQDRDAYMISYEPKIFTEVCLRIEEYWEQEKL